MRSVVGASASHRHGRRKTGIQIVGVPPFRQSLEKHYSPKRKRRLQDHGTRSNVVASERNDACDIR